MFSIQRPRTAIPPMYGIGRISTGVFCQQTPGQQRYRGFTLSFSQSPPLTHSIVCRSRTSAADIVASHYRCCCTVERANRRYIQSSKRLSKTSRDVHRPGANWRRINAARRDRVRFLISLSLCLNELNLPGPCLVLQIRQKPHFKQSLLVRYRKTYSTCRPACRSRPPQQRRRLRL